MALFTPSSMAYQGCPLLKVDQPWSCRSDRTTGKREDGPSAGMCGLIISPVAVSCF